MLKNARPVFAFFDKYQKAGYRDQTARDNAG
jgi:hypothetical protein